MIYLVEDDEAVRDSLRLLLTARAFAVADFASAEELFERADLGQCTCLILDVNLPGLDGVTALERLRAEGLRTPVVMISGRSDAQARRRAAALGAAAFLDKPIDKAVLLETIILAIHLREAPADR